MTLYSPQLLFGKAAQPSDLLYHLPFLDRARAEREHAHDMDSRVALAGYLVARLADRWLDRAEGAEELEGVTWQMHSTRKYVGELRANCPEVAHLDGILDAMGDAPSRRDAAVRLGLSAYAYYLEQEGRLEEGLDVLGLAARAAGDVVPADYVRFALTAARLNRLLARWDDALRAYSEGETAAAVAGDPSATLTARLGRANVARGRGDLPSALTQVQAVLADALTAGLRDVISNAYLDLGLVYEKQNRPLEGLQAVYQAFRHTEDEVQRTRVLGDLGVKLHQVGACAAARLAFTLALQGNASFAVAMNARIELMDLEGSAGNRLGFERYRRAVESEAARLLPSMSVDFQYKLGVCLARFGQSPQAQAAWAEGMRLAEQHGLNEWYFRIHRTAQDFELQQSVPEVAAEPTEAEFAPVVAEMERGLKEYSVLSA